METTTDTKSTKSTQWVHDPKSGFVEANDADFDHKARKDQAWTESDKCAKCWLPIVKVAR